MQLYEELRVMLGKGGFDLRKWRSSPQQVIEHIPSQLLELMRHTGLN